MCTDKNQKIVLLKASGSTQFPEDFQYRFHTHIYCHGGKAKFMFNSRLHNCKTGEFVFWLADSEISNLTFSKNFRATILFIEKDFLMDNIPSQSWSIDAILYSKENPVMHLNSKSDKEKVLLNFKLLYEKFQETTHRFYEEALKLQMQLFILEMWHTFSNEYERRKHTLQSGTLYERFLQLVQEHCMKEREVRFYSAKLNITSKHLNQICKVNTGITASHWIQRYTKERIILLLQNKNLNISEIADEMEFSSRSFFTRYVKKLLGVSPSAYRQRF